MRIKIYREKADVISPGPIWIAFEGCWMYTHDNLLGLLYILITEWRDDRHLVG